MGWQQDLSAKGASANLTTAVQSLAYTQKQHKRVESTKLSADYMSSVEATIHAHMCAHAYTLLKKYVHEL